ncbi:response regulator transcription factor [Candidatus Avelusimicrobium luingense]|uniref:response regulator transcription factor n=1 Tax=Candidatus Avelusimicrobium luingense TaxID=3416211 RepID=UPI003D104B36
MKKIVMIEDSKVLGTALSGALKIEGIEVFWAHNGVEGVTLAKQEKPDLILLDLMLPKLSGFDVCKLLKTDNDTWRIPVIVMSTLSDPESQDRAKEAGADFFIPKPYDLADTLKEIKKHLN